MPDRHTTSSGSGALNKQHHTTSSSDAALGKINSVKKVTKKKKNDSNKRTYKVILLNDVDLKTLDKETLPDLRWKPCNMLDDFSSSTKAMRQALPDVAYVASPRQSSSKRRQAKALQVACVKSQDIIEEKMGLKAKPFIGPIQPLEERVSRAAEQMGNLDISSNVNESGD